MPKTRSPRNRVTISDDNDLRKYRTELPNLIDDLDLSPSAYRLYGHYKRRAGASGGECTEGLRSISRHCKLAINTVRKGRDELIARKLITVRETTDKTGRHDFISIVNIWPQNFRKYAPEGVSDSDTRGVLNGARGVSPVDTGGVSASDTEERTIRKEEIKEEEKPQRATRLPVDFSIIEDMRKWASVYVPHVDLDAVLPEFRDYWIGVPGARGTKLDWEATWRNRMRELEARAPRNGNGHQPSSKASRTQEAFARARREGAH